VSGRPTVGVSNGSSAAQMSCAFQHLVRNRQPLGGLLGFGIAAQHDPFPSAEVLDLR